jgi:glutathione S-transferase
MHDWLGTTPATVFALCTALLALEMAGLAFATPLLRTKRNVWLNEEDALRFSGTVADVEHRDVARLVRVHRNLLENFVPFFALGVLWLVTGAPTAFGVWLFVAFAVARTAHVWLYLSRRGRLRTASHSVGFLVLVALAVGVAWHILRV